MVLNVLQALLPLFGGLSTPWVIEEYRHAEDLYQEHLRLIETFDEPA